MRRKIAKRETLMVWVNDATGGISGGVVVSHTASKEGVHIPVTSVTDRITLVDR